MYVYIHMHTCRMYRVVFMCTCIGQFIFITCSIFFCRDVITFFSTVLCYILGVHTLYCLQKYNHTSRDYPKKEPTAFKKPPPSSLLYASICSSKSGIERLATLDPAVSKKMGLHSINTGFGGNAIKFKSSCTPLSKS